MIYKLLFFSLILPLSLFSYIDSDMDGVDDVNDQCLYTPFSDLVNIKGCSIESLGSQHDFSLVVGLSYSDTDYLTLSKTNTLTSSIELDYYYKNFSFSLSSSYYNNDSQTYSTSGINDTYLGLEYTLLDGLVYVSMATGLILPTYETPLNNNNTDYTANINLSYNINNLTVFGLCGYTIVEDDDIEGIVNYQNTLYVSGGIGYFLTAKLYTSLLYSESDSIYKGIQKISTVSVYAYYSINDKLFTSVDYAYGLSDSASDNYMSVKLGYKF